MPEVTTVTDFYTAFGSVLCMIKMHLLLFYANRIICYPLHFNLLPLPKIVSWGSSHFSMWRSTKSFPGGSYSPEPGGRGRFTSLFLKDIQVLSSFFFSHKESMSIEFCITCVFAYFKRIAVGWISSRETAELKSIHNLHVIIITHLLSKKDNNNIIAQQGSFLEKQESQCSHPWMEKPWCFQPPFHQHQLIWLIKPGRSLRKDLPLHFSSEAN